MENMNETLDLVNIELIAELGRVDFKLNQILEMEVGDVFALPTRVGEDATLYIDGVDKVKFKARIGNSGKHNAVQVSQLVRQEYESNKDSDMGEGPG